MSHTSIVRPLGEVLLQTGLVSAQQVKEALQDQAHNSTRKLGEILARRGWIKQETANFFAEEWPEYLTQQRKQPIGQYLRDASLLDSSQVRSILEEQTHTDSPFGELIVEKGWLSQTTVDFFLDAFADEETQSENQQHPGLSLELDEPLKQIQAQLLDNQHCDPYQLLLTYQKALTYELPKTPHSPAQIELLKLGLLVERAADRLIANPEYRHQLDTRWVDHELGKLRPFEKVRINLFKLGERASLPFAAIEEVFSWTGREPFLTQCVCQAIYETGDFIPADAEKQRVATIVHAHILGHWENKVAAQHFQAIINQIHAYPDPLALLKRYQQILHQDAHAATNDPEQEALKKLGLIVQEHQDLKVANRIYAEVFNPRWVNEEIDKQVPRAGHKSTAMIPVASRDTTTSPPLRFQPEQKQKTNMRLGTILLGLLLLGCLGMLMTIFAKRAVKSQTAKRYFDQGNALFSQGQHEAAIAKYNEVLDLDGNYHQAWTNRGYALAGIGDYDQMLSSCRSATIIAPDAIYAWNCQGEALHNLKQFEGAIAAYEQAIKLDPEDPVFWINKSESLLAQENFEESLNSSQKAIDRLEKLQTQQDGSNTIKNELSIAWNMRGRVFQKTEQYPQAIEAYDKSLTYNPSYFSAQLGKGITFKRLAQYEEAQNQFMQTLNQTLTENQQAEVWFYAGLTYCTLGQPSKAVEAYDNALRLKPAFEAAEASKNQACS